jgi:hypothetical protein
MPRPHPPLGTRLAGVERVDMPPDPPNLGEVVS